MFKKRRMRSPELKACLKFCAVDQFSLGWRGAAQ